MFRENLDFMYALSREGMKLDLEVMKSFSEMVGNPERDFKSVHIAGTNGKGSTSAYLYNILRQKFKAGLYTSPHLIKFNERIVLDRNQIEDSYIEDFISKYRPVIQELHQVNRNPTFFEVTTELAFKYFSEKKADFSSIEVGLGGRLDSTNIIMPEISVITQIGFEHADRLGCSLSSISFEKAGIVKKGIPVVLSDTKPEVVKTVSRVASLRNSEFIHVPKACKISEVKMDAHGTEFDLQTSSNSYHIRTRMIGDFQPSNIAATVLAIETLKDHNISATEIEKGIEETMWPARLEIINRDPLIILDSAHNPPAANALARSFKKIFNKKPVLVIGMLSDKDSFSYLSVMSSLTDEIIITTPNEKMRAVNPKTLAETASRMFRNVKVVYDPIEAYEYAKKISSCVLVTGSIYLVGEIKKHEKSSVISYVTN